MAEVFGSGSPTRTLSPADRLVRLKRRAKASRANMAARGQLTVSQQKKAKQGSNKK